MKKLFLDFETYYDDEYSLRKMTPAEYVYDPRFEVLGCSFKFPGERPVYVDGPMIPPFLAALDWTQIWAISHNALFDMLVLKRLGHVAARYGCTLSMARNWLSHMTGSVALASLAKFYGLDAKWSTLIKTKGVNYQMLVRDPVLHAEVKGYALDDLAKCEYIWDHILADGFPEGELDIIDMVVKMAAQPAFVLDRNLVAAHYAEVVAKKQALLDRVGLDNRDNLMRDEALAAMLIFEGVVPPMKKSKTTGKEMFAFAKTDKAFTALADDDNPMVQALVAARLGHKSTLEETRTQRFMKIGEVSPMFPIPLKYSGAHTHRFSGDWSINAQNLGRKSKLRHALRAPPGKKVVSIDASQIEARLNAVLSEEWDLVASFRNGDDVYAHFAEKIYGYAVNKKDHPIERFVGKTGILSLGYSSSALVFQNMCRVQSEGKVDMAFADAVNIVNLYRDMYPNIKRNWGFAGKIMLPTIAGTLSMSNKNMWGPVEVRKNQIILPNGNRLRYRDMAYIMDEETSEFKWIFKRGNRPIYMYGAKLVENVIQALAFVHIMEVARRIFHMTNGLLFPAHQVHDELIYIVDEALAEQVATLVRTEMSKPPSWMPNAPLAAESGIGDSYGDAK